MTGTTKRWREWRRTKWNVTRVLAYNREDGDNDNKEPKRCQTCVVWVIGEFFKKNLFMFLNTNKCFNVYLGYYSGVEQQQWQQRAQMTPDAHHLGHTWVSSFFSSCFHTNRSFILYIGYYLHNPWQGGCWMVTMMRKSPNDDRHTSFGPLVFFFFSFSLCFLFILTDILLCILPNTQQGGCPMVMTTRKSPNNSHLASFVP